jgi:hypothetical protein
VSSAIETSASPRYHHPQPPLLPGRRSPERSEQLPGVSTVKSEMLPSESLRRSLALSANEQLMKKRKETDAFNWAHHGWKGQSSSSISKIASPRLSSTASNNDEEPPSADGRYGLPWELAQTAVDSLRRVASFEEQQRRQVY